MHIRRVKEWLKFVFASNIYVYYAQLIDTMYLLNVEACLCVLYIVLDVLGTGANYDMRCIKLRESHGNRIYDISYLNMVLISLDFLRMSVILHVMLSFLQRVKIVRVKIGVTILILHIQVNATTM